MEPVLPASIHTEPDMWIAAVEAAQSPSSHQDRAAQARLAAQLGKSAIDASTLRALLARVFFNATNSEVTLGWLH